MVGWVIIIAAVTIMARAAEMEGRSTLLWGGITFVLCLVCNIIIPLPLIDLVMGLILSYLAMFVVNVIGKD